MNSYSGVPQRILSACSSITQLSFEYELRQEMKTYKVLLNLPYYRFLLGVTPKPSFSLFEYIHISLSNGFQSLGWDDRVLKYVGGC
jgi:hypothetical protein